MRLARNRPDPGHDAARGFTMVEIAIALGVIAIALVAIIGIMPTGVNVQRTNRDDTVINQDGKLWVEAIRTGARGLDYLTNHVEAIWITNVDSSSYHVTIYTNAPGLSNRVNATTTLVGYMTNGSWVVGLLSRPKYLPVEFPIVTNHIVAYVHAVSGSAADQNEFMRTNRTDFLYRLTSEVVPFNHFPPTLTNYAVSGLSTQEWIIRSNNWLLARNQAVNAYEVCLTLQGPVIHRGARLGYQVLGTPKTFRTVISAGQLFSEGLFFFQPTTYVQVRP